MAEVAQSAEVAMGFALESAAAAGALRDAAVVAPEAVPPMVASPKEFPH